jgi:RNA polymerase sigma factor (sigma-70 family)
VERPTPTTTSAPDEQVAELARVVRRVVRARVRDHHLAEDLVQETLARVYAHQPALEPEEARPFAIVVAKNLVTSTRRADGRRAGNAHRLVDLRTVEPPEDAVVRRDERTSMSRAMANLNDRDREVLLSHEVHDVSTRDIAEGDGTTPGAIAVRLAAARAKLRVEYVLSLRREPPLEPRCRSVLVALSAGDRRRQAALDADGHLRTCGRCSRLSEPLRERRRASAVLLPLLAVRDLLGRTGSAIRRNPGPSAAGAAAVAVAAAVLAAQVGGGGDTGPEAPAAQGRPPAATAAPPPPAGTEPVGGPVTVDGTALGRLAPPDLAALVGSPVTVQDATVSSVPADEGFWIDDGAGGRFWVQLTGTGESPVAIEPGTPVSFTGVLTSTPADFSSAVGLDAAEGSSDLDARAVHIEVAAVDVPPR